MPAGSWYTDPARPDCEHAATSGGSLELHGDGWTPVEHCLDCRAVRPLSPRVELRVAYRSEPLVIRKAEFPEPTAEKPRAGWRRPSFVPESWWDGSPPKRYA